MRVRELVKNTPNGILAVCATIIFVAVIGAFVAFGITGADATEFRSFLNTLLNAVAVLLSGGAFIAAGASAKSSAKAEEQTNGQLDTRIRDAVSEAINGPKE